MRLWYAAKYFKSEILIIADLFPRLFWDSGISKLPIHLEPGCSEAPHCRFRLKYIRIKAVCQHFFRDVAHKAIRGEHQPLWANGTKNYN